MKKRIRMLLCMVLAAAIVLSVIPGVVATAKNMICLLAKSAVILYLYRMHLTALEFAPSADFFPMNMIISTQVPTTTGTP